jgi:carbonic anhydrase
MYTVAVLTFLAFSQIYSASASCMHNTNLHRRATEEDGKTVKLPNFSYEGLTGPTNWQAIDAENTQCAAGLKQSPINIKTAEITKTKPGDVRMDIPAGQEMTFENLGTNVEVLVEGTTMVGEKKFKLKQFHYHTPSEHKIDEEYYPVEVHMVHEAEG